MRYDSLLRRTTEIALDYPNELPDRPVGPTVDHGGLYAALDRPLTNRGEDPITVIEQLVADADPGIVACVGPRYFGFVHGGALPASVAADWMVTTWDIACSMYVCSPAVAVIEEIAAGWLCDLFGLSGRGREISTGFTTGCNMANFTGLAAARHALLARANWDVESQGLFGAPEINVVVGAEAHGSIFAALQMLGLGRDRVTRIDLTIDGADEIDANLDLIKGGGGALLREKIVASVSDRYLIIADESKLVPRLGAFALPVEVTPFALAVVTARLEAEGAAPVLRRGAGGDAVVTDEGHHLLEGGTVAGDEAVPRPRLAGGDAPEQTPGLSGIGSGPGHCTPPRL